MRLFRIGRFLGVSDALYAGKQRDKWFVLPHEKNSTLLSCLVCYKNVRKTTDCALLLTEMILFSE